MASNDPGLAARALDPRLLTPPLRAGRWTALWIAGDEGALVAPRVALVGTRDADPSALALARSFARALVEADATVLSGGALGVDAAAHAGALEAGGRTVAVLPSGLAQLYPLRHRGLFRRMVDAGGALLSTFPPASPPAPWTFVRRNELLAELCDLLVVVQAGRSSGSLLAAQAARAFGRRVLAVPAAPDDPRGQGCLALLRAGAELCATPRELVAALERRDGPLLPRSALAVREAPPREPRPSRVDAAPREARAQRAPREARAPRAADAGEPTLTGDEAAVYERLEGDTPRHLDELARASALPPARVRVALLGLLLKGLAREPRDACFARCGEGRL